MTKNYKELNKLLLTTIRKLDEGKITSEKGRVINNLARTSIKLAKLQLIAEDSEIIPELLKP